MAVFYIDQEIPNDDWVSIQALVGEAAGVDVIIQNIGSTDVRAVENNTKPMSSLVNIGTLIKNQDRDQYRSNVAETTNSTWVKSIGEGKTNITVQVP
jgi:hypothetical protein